MVEKKLLALAGVVGIIALSSCLLPPLPRRHTPPPPTHTGLDGLRSIRIKVVNSSPSHHLDPAGLAQKIAEKINEQASKRKMTIRAGVEAQGVDAVLVVTVLGETAKPVPAGETKDLSVNIMYSAKLTRMDGAQLWQETAAGNWTIPKVVVENAADAWKLADFMNEVEQALSDRLAFRLLHGL